MDSAKYRNLSQYLKLEMNEAGVGAGYFQCMKFSLLSVGFFFWRGGGGPSRRSKGVIVRQPFVCQVASNVMHTVMNSTPQNAVLFMFVF